MYSYEDRVRAVELYVKLRKRTGATIRQLGYPTKNSLKSWHEEYEQHLDLSPGYVRSKSKYSEDQMEKAVEHYAEHGRCIASMIKALGYRRIQAMLSRQCVRLSEKVVQRLMKQEGLFVAKPKRRRYGSYLGEISPAPENLVKRASRLLRRMRSG